MSSNPEPQEIISPVLVHTSDCDFQKEIDGIGLIGARTAYPAAYAAEAVCKALNAQLPGAMDAVGVKAAFKLRIVDPKTARPLTMKEDAVVIGAKYVVGQAAYQAVQADRMMDAAKGAEATTAQKEAASAQIQISLSSSKSVSETKRTQETAFGSSIMAGGNVSIVALGEKGVAGSGNLSIVGSDVTGKNVLLAATNDLYLLSQAQTSTETSTNKNSGWKVGVGIGVSDSGSGGGINIFASGYAGKGNANGNGTTYQETQISARDN